MFTITRDFFLNMAKSSTFQKYVKSRGGILGNECHATQRVFFLLFILDFTPLTTHNHEETFILVLKLVSRFFFFCLLFNFYISVQKYRETEDGLGKRVQKLNWHSVAKKSSRINQKITQFTGFNSQV